MRTFTALLAASLLIIAILVLGSCSQKPSFEDLTAELAYASAELGYNAAKLGIPIEEVYKKIEAIMGPRPNKEVRGHLWIGIE